MADSLSAQAAQIFYLQGSATAGATANGNGTPAVVDGNTGAQQVEIVESGGGTCTVALQGAFDGSSGAKWYAVGYQQIDAVATPTRAVANISVTANSAHVYQVLDPYAQLRAVISASSSETVTIRVYCIPA